MTEVLEILRRGDLRPLGRILGSSNSAVLVELTLSGRTQLAIHKPVAFERPLWDYPDGHLAHRENAAYLVSQAGGFDVVPATVLREGPWGPGSLQEWIGGPEEEPELLVTVCPPGEEPPGWRVVLAGEDEEGEEVVLAHADDDQVRTTAVLDAVLNNSDRKGLHLVRVPDGVRGFDHGVSLGVEPKLRTVLWGWAGEPLADEDRERLRRLESALAGRDDEAALTRDLAGLVTAAERAALRARVERLLRTGRHPLPGTDWPAIPWPAM